MNETFFYSSHEIFNSVKLESSLLAERQTNREGVSLFDFFVFDEEYHILFRQLFFEAQAALMEYIPSQYLYSAPPSSHDLNGGNFTEENGFLFVLCKKDYPQQYIRFLDIKFKEFLIAYIMWRWLETKLPEYAQIYLTRLNACAESIRKEFNRTAKLGLIRPFP